MNLASKWHKKNSDNIVSHGTSHYTTVTFQNKVRFFIATEAGMDEEETETYESELHHTWVTPHQGVLEPTYLGNFLSQLCLW